MYSILFCRERVAILSSCVPGLNKTQQYFAGSSSVNHDVAGRFEAEALPAICFESESSEHKEEEARQAAAVLPSVEVLDKIIRYETTLQRLLFRAIRNWNGCDGCDWVKWCLHR